MMADVMRLPEPIAMIPRRKQSAAAHGTHDKKPGQGSIFHMILVSSLTRLMIYTFSRCSDAN
jgi:hypothetical protein